MYSPSQVCAAAGGIKAPTLRAWHNTDGLNVGDHQENGRRAYSDIDAALVIWVAHQTGADGHGLGFMQHAAAVQIANRLREPLTALWNGYYAAFGNDVFKELDAVAPMAFATPNNGALGRWDVEVFDTSGAWVGALIDRRSRRRPPVLIELSAIMKHAKHKLPRMADGAGHE